MKPDSAFASSATEMESPVVTHVPFGRTVDCALAIRFELETPFFLPANGGTLAQRHVANASAHFALGLLDEAESELNLPETLQLDGSDRWLRAVLRARIQMVRGQHQNAAQTIAENWPDIRDSVAASGHIPARLSNTPALIAHQAGLFDLERDILQNSLRWRRFDFGHLQMACCLSCQNKPAQALAWLEKESAEILVHVEGLLDPDLARMWSWCASGDLDRRSRSRLRRVLLWMCCGVQSRCAYGDLDLISFRHVSDHIAQQFVLQTSSLSYAPAHARGSGSADAWAYLDHRFLEAVKSLKRLEHHMGMHPSA